MDTALSPAAQPNIVFSIVANPGTTDGRVMKQAEALRDAGYAIHIIGRKQDGFPDHEQFKSINVHRFDFFCSHHDNEAPARIEALQVFGSQRPLLANIAAARTATRVTKTAISPPPQPTRKGLVGKLWRKIQKKLLPKDFKEKIRQHREFLIKQKHEEILSKRKHRVLLLETHFYFLYLQMAENILRIDFACKPQVIHAHDLMALPAAVALARRFNSTVIYDAHEIETERDPSATYEQKKFIQRLEEDLFNEVSEMIVCCGSAADFYFPIFKKKIPTIIMNAPDDRYIGCKAPEGADVRSQCRVRNDTPLIVYAGNIGFEARGLDKVVQALNYLPGYHLAIQGPRIERSDNWLKAIAEKEGASDRVHFLPPVSPKILIDTLSTGDVGVCAFQDVSLNYRYALPNKLFEMAFAGLPLCLSDLVEMRRFTERLKNGELMDETNPKEIARTIKTVFENRSKYQLTESCRNILINEYSWGAQTNRLQELYSRIFEPSVSGA